LDLEYEESVTDENQKSERVLQVPQVYMLCFSHFHISKITNNFYNVGCSNKSEKHI